MYKTEKSILVKTDKKLKSFGKFIFNKKTYAYESIEFFDKCELDAGRVTSDLDGVYFSFEIVDKYHIRITANYAIDFNNFFDEIVGYLSRPEPIMTNYSGEHYILSDEKCEITNYYGYENKNGLLDDNNLDLYLGKFTKVN